MLLVIIIAKHKHNHTDIDNMRPRSLLIKKYPKLNRTSSYGNSWVNVRTTPLEKKTESAENPQFFFLSYQGTLHTFQYSYIQKAVLQNRYPGFRT